MRDFIVGLGAFAAYLGLAWLLGGAVLALFPADAPPMFIGIMTSMAMLVIYELCVLIRVVGGAIVDLFR